MCNRFATAISFIKLSGTGARVGVVGSYAYPYPWAVKEFVSVLPNDSILISGVKGRVEKTVSYTTELLRMEHEKYQPDWCRYREYAAEVFMEDIVKSNLCCLVAFLHDRSIRVEEMIYYAMDRKIPVFMFSSSS